MSPFCAASASAAAGAGAGHYTKPDTAASSKRDRKRQQLIDRLAALKDKHSRDRNMTYRDQLQKIQVDLSLVQRFDPYAPDALSQISQLRQEHSSSQGEPILAENGRSMLDMAGPGFQDFLQSVEDAIERRDVNMVSHKRDHDTRLIRIDNNFRVKVETARNEHSQLTGTIRDRLINSISSRKNRLNREKEALEISDSNALLLHPNQFSITNPTSPGGAQIKRASRMRRDLDDLGTGGLNDTKKRKRNGAGADDEGSPAPLRRALDPPSTSTTALWQSEKVRGLAKPAGPVYSIEKLFTEKELQMTHNAAALAAHELMIRHPLDTNKTLESISSDSDSGDEPEQEPVGLAPPPLLAPVMERLPSHTTRSTRAAEISLLDAKAMKDDITHGKLAALIRSMFTVEAPKIPTQLVGNYTKPHGRLGETNTLPTLSQEDQTRDVYIIGCCKSHSVDRWPGAAMDNSPGVRELAAYIAHPIKRSWEPGFDPDRVSHKAKPQEELFQTKSSPTQEAAPGDGGPSSDCLLSSTDSHEDAVKEEQEQEEQEQEQEQEQEEEEEQQQQL